MNTDSGGASGEAPRADPPSSLPAGSPPQWHESHSAWWDGSRWLDSPGGERLAAEPAPMLPETTETGQGGHKIAASPLWTVGVTLVFGLSLEILLWLKLETVNPCTNFGNDLAGWFQSVPLILLGGGILGLVLVRSRRVRGAARQWAIFAATTEMVLSVFLLLVNVTITLRAIWCAVG